MSEEGRSELDALRDALARVRDDVRSLERRLAALEGGTGESDAWAPEAHAAPAVPARAAVDTGVPRPTAPPRPRLSDSVRAQRPPRQPSEFELALRAFVTEGNPLNKIGALMLLLGTGILFKYAVDNDWIGPTGRVMLGLGAGAAFFGAGEFYQRRGWHRFASGLVLAGQGLLFLSTFFGQQQYQIVPSAVAFGMYVLFTATAVAQSLRYNAQGLALGGVLGGYLTPLLASTGQDQFVLLSCYLLVLNTGVFAIAYHRTWQPLKWMAFLLTVPYVAAWVFAYERHPEASPALFLHWLLPFLWVFFSYFAAIPTWRSLLRREPIDAYGQLLTVMNGVVHFLFAAMLLYDDHRAWLGIVAVAVTVMYVVISSLVVRQPLQDAKGLRVFAGTAAAFLVLATPFLASGPTITLVWCAETAFLAWACAQPRFGFLRFHVLVMLGIICGRLLEYDGLLRPDWVDPEKTYIPFTHLRSYPPLAAALTFALAARFLSRLKDLRVPWPGGVMAVGIVVLLAAIDAEAYRTSRYLLAPHAYHELHDAIQAGLLIAIVGGLWLSIAQPLARGRVPWGAAFVLAALLTLWVANALFWPVSYGRMLRVLEPQLGLWWLHGATILMLPLLALFTTLGRAAPERAGGLTRVQWQTVCGVAALLVTMCLLRREIFAITHAPPVADLFPDTGRRAAYRMLLSLSYGLLGFGVYLSAIRIDSRPRLFGAYALYVITAGKVIFFDFETRNQLYRGVSVLLVGAILILSHYFAERQRHRHAT